MNAQTAIETLCESRLTDALKKLIVRNNDLYKIFHARTGTGPLDGGCVALALALQAVIGGKPHVLVGRHVIRGGEMSPTQAEHCVLKKGDKYWDGDGESTGERLIARWQADEGVIVDAIRPLEDNDLPESPRDHVLVQELVDHLSRANTVLQGHERNKSSAAATTSKVPYKRQATLSDAVRKRRGAGR